jgi:hypothetical protein
VNINRNRLKSENTQGSQTVKGTDQKLKKRNEADLALDLIKKELSVKHKYPYQILLENAPNAHELNFQMEIDNESGEMSWWEKMSPEEAIREVEEIRDRYAPGSGWVHADEIEDGSETAITERNDLRKVVAHMKRKYKKHYGGK